MAGNVDNPEGGLDALLQVMACKDRIGWRPDSRKIILVATDNDYHNAMDGKLAGTSGQLFVYFWSNRKSAFCSLPVFII